MNKTNYKSTSLSLGNWKRVDNFPPNRRLHLTYVCPFKATPELGDKSTKVQGHEKKLPKFKLRYPPGLPCLSLRDLVLFVVMTILTITYD